MSTTNPDSPSSYETTPPRPLPPTQFYSIEYPGYISSNKEAVGAALETLGGQSAVSKVFRQPRAKVLDLRLRPDDVFAHPIPGEAVGVVKVLMKVTTRKKRRKASQTSSTSETQLPALGEPGPSTPRPITDAPREPIEGDGEVDWVDEGVYTAEALGTITKTVRFRAMADFQFIPDESDPIVQLRQSIEKMDESTVQAIQNYSFPVEQEDYTLPLDHPPTDTKDPTLPHTKSNLRIPGFPVFSRAIIPAQYNYKANPFSTTETVNDPETGEQKQRLINKTRFKGFGAISIDFHDTNPVPTGPTEQMSAAASTVSQDLLKRAGEMFEVRPVWARVALLNQFNQSERREVFHSKIIIPLVSYAFNDGPFRDMYIRFGYDPRQDVEARFYQRVTFRYTAPNHTRRKPVVEGRNPADAPRPQIFDQTHIFDGKTEQHEAGPGFQLCDIHDPLLERLINDSTDLRDTCHERDGWYSAPALDRIKAITRRKLFGLLEEGRIVPDEECTDILERKTVLAKNAGVVEERLSVPESVAAKKRKRNRAKGVAPWEEDAAARLKGKLRKKAEEGLDDEEEDVRDSDSDYRP